MAQLTSDMPRIVTQGGCHLRVEDDLEVILAQRNVTLLQWEALAEDLGGVVWTTASPRGVSDQDVRSPLLHYHSPYPGESIAKSSTHLLLVSLLLAAGIFQMSL